MFAAGYSVLILLVLLCVAIRVPGGGAQSLGIDAGPRCPSAASNPNPAPAGTTPAAGHGRDRDAAGPRRRPCQDRGQEGAAQTGAETGPRGQASRFHCPQRRRGHSLAAAALDRPRLRALDPHARVTAHITTDLTPMPLFWLMTLTLYLLSFILVFARWPVVWVEEPHRICLYVQRWSWP